MRQLLCAAAAALLWSSSALAATYVWNGAVSDRFSEPANWAGGSPASDPKAELSFPSAASRKTLLNDLPDLTVRGIAFSGTGYTLSGSAIRMADATISDSSTGPTTITCELVVDGVLTLATAGDALTNEGLVINGRIGGTGSVKKSGTGRVTFGGQLDNTYSGSTRVTAGQLVLRKPMDVNAIPGDLFIEQAPVPGAEVMSLEFEQIADNATVDIARSGVLRLARNEHIGKLVIARGGEVTMSEKRSGSIPYTGALLLNGDVEVPANGADEDARLDGSVVLPATRTITLAPDVRGGLQMLSVTAQSLSGGLILRGEARLSQEIEVAGGYAGATIVEGPLAVVSVPNSPVVVRSGVLQGKAASITVEGGTLDITSYPPATATGELRLTSAAKVSLSFNDTNLPRATAGSVNLGNATLQYIADNNLQHIPGRTYLILNNAGSAPIQGTFASLPEGALIENRFRVSYVGGTGNDLTLTDVSKFTSQTTLSLDGSFVRDKPFTLSARVSSSSRTQVSGTVTFLEGSTVIATVPLDARSTATATYTPTRVGQHTITARFDGTPTTDPSSESRDITVNGPAPVVTSVEPSSVTSGETVTLVVRGSEFTQDSIIYAGFYAFTATFVSSTELRATWKVPRTTATQDTTLRVSSDSRQSNAIPFRIVGVPAPQSTLTFGENWIQGRVTPGASSAWIRDSVVHLSNGTRHETEYGLVKDTDNDGSVTWTLKNTLSPVSLVLMVDISNGTINVGRPDRSIPEEMPFPMRFLRDETGAFSHIVDGAGGHTTAWIRPGIGAWGRYYLDGATTDEQPIQGQLITSTKHMQPFQGSPAPPPGVEPGDVFVATWDSELRLARDWYGQRVDESLERGPGVLALRGTWSVSETDGVARVVVTRTGGSDGAVTVKYATADDTAIAGVHYQPVAGTLTFGNGEIVKTVEIPLLTDLAYSGMPRFALRLSDPAGATLGTSSATTVTIRDDEPIPTLAVSPDVVIAEGDSGSRQVTVTATLAGATLLPVKGRWMITDEYGDRTHAPFTFAPGESTKTTVATFAANTVSQPDRKMTVSVVVDFSEPVKVTRSQATITIRDDDPLPQLTVLDASVAESGGTVRIQLALTGTASRPVSVKYTTINGTAAAGADYVSKSGIAEWSGNFGPTIEIPITPDTTPETPEWFYVVFSDAKNVVLTRTAALVTISDDDVSAQPAVSVAPASVVEGDSGLTTARFTVLLSGAAQSRVTVRWRTADRTADSRDYVPASGEIVFEAGELAKTIAVQVSGDKDAEGDETFAVELLSATNATPSNAIATGTIVNDDRSSRGRAVRH